MAASTNANPRVLLMVTGGIAAYKSCFLARLLLQAGFSVKVAMTDAATRFVTPMTFQVLTGHPVATDLWGERQSDALDHVEYARWADLVVVAPATADIMAKAAHGIADEIVSTMMLAFPGPLLIAPAMNDNMWRHPATVANREILAAREVNFVGPGTGWLACGTVDEGRMAEPEEILAAVRKLAEGLPAGVKAEPAAVSQAGFWAGKKVLITAGPTHEPIDPVRYVANRSSGTMGYALASAAIGAGAEVTLISGPVALTPPRGLADFRSVESTADMAQAVGEAQETGADWLIMSAAVADFKPANYAPGKLKKDVLGDGWSLAMTRNPDILGEVVPNHPHDGLRVVGFALETDDMVGRASVKREAKGMDYILANDPTAAGSGFGSENHQVTLIGVGGIIWESDSLPKETLAGEILQQLARADN
ncbi:MAG: bifunctional phosphopantothenoylcysteine decarboxylase/phosphopantothenate--cysteine ligase CoaBC [Candidatus Krumholzibacteria bacterium]|nr:bifunctional phosphopantothenoylcysteine decarboxylase/phosphopantothenate--cysteine ligase CoaBC [Candidatus Krumholzibacteria bacterium]